jgi:hypothetical protein
MISTIGQWASGAAAGTNGIIAGVFGAIKAGQQRRKMNRYLNQQDSENTAWYNANALSDYTQRADAQNLIKQLRENLNKNNKRAENMAVVTGATPEQAAVAKEQSNKAISDTYSNLGAMGQQWKDRVTDRYMNRRQDIANQRMGILSDKAQSYENLMQNGFNTLQQSFLSIANGSGGGGGGASSILSSQPLQRTVGSVPQYMNAPGPSVNPSAVQISNPYS